MSSKTIIIKKYENRRLYDTTGSRYVNLDEVARMLQRDEDVQVVDATTGEDITRLILTQIIVENAKTTNSDFPLDVLRQMVVASGQAGQESTLKYMNAMFDLYQKTFRLIPSPVNPFGFYSTKPDEVGGNAATPPAAEAGHAAQGSRTTHPAKPEKEETDEMKRRLAQLEELVSKLSPEKATRKKSPAKRRRSRPAL
jgi:polyhydroxyalkanoate synthesis repressor PhaR